MTPRIVLSAVIGNALEWYDFTVYAFLATILGAHFFSEVSPSLATLFTFAVFGVGFVARPLGGVLIGRFGDRVGRKPALLLTVGMMAVGTGLIGILPGYRSIGLWAPAALVFARALQGFSAGGEWGSSASFLVEWAPRQRRGLYGSFHPGSIFAGQLTGTAIAYLLFALLGDAAMRGWGYRVPFLLGALIGPLGLLARRGIDETPVFRAAAARAVPVGEPLGAARLLFAFCFVAVQSAGIYLYLSYFPTFLQQQAGWKPSDALAATALATVCTGIAVVGSGAASDRIGRKPLLLASCLVFLLLSTPLVWPILHGAPRWLSVLLQCLLSANCGVFIGSMTVALVEMFPTRNRLTGLSTAYNLASMVFGGFAPTIATGLMHLTGTPIAVTYYVVFAALVSLPAILLFEESAGRALD